MTRFPLHLDDSLQQLQSMGLGHWCEQLLPLLEARLEPGRNGNLPHWLAALEQLPDWLAEEIDLAVPVIQLGSGTAYSDEEQQHLRKSLMRLHPWRKGPFRVFGVDIDSEWRSDWKWARLQHQIQPLQGRAVLDVGCGNGYYALRMVGDGAASVVGIDPNLLFMCQFHALVSFLPVTPPIHLFPVGLEDVPEKSCHFDTVFSMGVLYHRKSPIDHLYQLRGALRSGGELVLETLVIEGKRGEVLVPGGRYAKMRNVWFIPTVEELIHWLQRVGFVQIRCLDQSVTTVEEQRRTGWMEFESLPDFLDPVDGTKTVEGHPAPRRATLSAVAP